MILLYIITLLAILFLIGSGFYAMCGWFKWLYHDILKWHVPKEETIIYDSLGNAYAICKYCEDTIQQDSQGNWF